VRRDFWSGRKVFITGHTGFKGAWLTLLLAELGAHVSAFSLPPPTTPSLFEDANVVSGIAHGIGDIRNINELAAAIEAAQPEVIFHLAAQSLVRESYRDPVETYQTNVIGTANLLQAVRGCRSARAVIVVTSDKCYESREWEWPYRETDRLGGRDPYSSSKSCAEIVTAAFRSSFFPASSFPEHRVAIATARAGNVIGGWDWAADRLIPDVIRALLSGSAVVLRNPEAVRPWQHVLDALAGYLVLAEKLIEKGIEFGEAWNFGPVAEDTTKVRELVSDLIGQWGKGSYELGESALPETAALRLDSSRARVRLGWSPRLRLPDALSWTTDFYRRAIAGEAARTVATHQIREFLERAPC
jgi:CDP-glucose 4,6-dehydratase